MNIEDNLYPNKEKRKKELQDGQGIYISATVLILLGMAGCIMMKIFSIHITWPYPCFLKEVVHLYCPGCGGTRAFYALLRFDLPDAVLSNPLVPYMAGIFLYYYIGTTLAVLCKGRRIFFRPGKWMYLIGILLLVYTAVIRNVMAVFWGIDYLNEVARFW